MEWINEPDEDDRYLMHSVLLQRPEEPLAPAFVAFWKRILSDGRATAAAWASLSIELNCRQSEQDEQGYMRAVFRNAQHKPCAGMPQYILRSDALACVQNPGEDMKVFQRRLMHWMLEQYTSLKVALRHSEVKPLFDLINTVRPLHVDATAVFNWFDLQVGQDSFGRMASDDRALLDGTDVNPADRLHDLLPGGSDTANLLRELGQALIAYTPPTFQTICCQITEGVEQGQRALFYDISCPQHPDDGTTVVNDRVHKAATRLVQQMSPSQGAFPGIAIRIELQKDGTWRHNMRLLSRAA